MALNASVNHAILWTTPAGDLQCVVLRYDDTRYQLRLTRSTGTVKAQLFARLDEAVAASKQWRLAVESQTR